MKVLKYQLMTEAKHGTEEHPDIQQIFSEVIMSWSESNEEIAKREAYNGEYNVHYVCVPIVVYWQGTALHVQSV